MSPRFNILSLSGGGFLGLYTISLLTSLERSSGRPIAGSCDLLAGTSVGGIIALGLAAEVPAEKIKTAFERNGTAIFSDRPAPTTAVEAMLDMPKWMFKPRYKSDALRQTIVEIVGEDRCIGDLRHRVIVPAVNLTKGRPQMFKTPHHPDFRTDLHLRVVDVALATSAAPTYFPVAEIGNSLFADGGLYGNSPDLFAVHEAVHFLKQRIEDVHVLSIGTTTSQFSFSHTLGRDLGLFHWGREQRLVNVILSSQQQSVDYMLQHQLGSRYLRLDAAQSKEQERHLALDVATHEAQKTIRGLADATYQASVSDNRLQTFIAHQAAVPLFHT